jgi:hypothetical protein
VRGAAALAAVLVALVLPATAGATGTAGSTPPNANAVSTPASLTVPPPNHRLTGVRVERIADAVPKIRDLLHRHPKTTRQAFLKGAAQWQVSYYRNGKETGQVLIDDATGVVTEAWTGFQVAWTMARGYPGAFGRKVNTTYVWIPLLVLFCAPFVRPRRWRSLIHLDLAVLCALSVSLAFFNHGKIGLSVPLVYPVLLYVLGRMLWIGFRKERTEPEPMRLLVPAAWLAIGVIFLLGFRIGLNVTNSNVIDVGYSGVIGAHKILHGEQLYGKFPKDDAQGDTYGTVDYLAYVPFVAALGWSGTWDDLPAAHAAAIFFDVMTLLALFLLGRRVRGPTLGIALAWAWVAYPFTAYVSSTNANDSLVALLVVLTLLVATSAPARGAGVALAGLTKFAPLALAPLMLRRPRDGRLTGRDAALYAIGFLAATALVILPLLSGEGLRALYDRTLGYQASRGSPFSVWGLYGWHTPQVLVEVLAVGFALSLAWVPRARSVPQVAALSAAVLIAFQLGITHWFYLYMVWFFPMVMLALLGQYPEPAPESARSPMRTAAAVPT